jgi:pimeloyl-ACP methyl ester carboxylesterase
MGYLAHRGWDCHAVNLRGRSRGSDARGSTAPADVGLREHLEDLDAVIAACDAPPILIGHDLGGLLALSSQLAPVRAVVALAPLVPASHHGPAIPAVSDLRARLAVKIRKHLAPPKGRDRRLYFGAKAQEPLVAESAVLARQLADADLPYPLCAGVPTLMVAGSDDQVVPVGTVAALANKIGADMQRIDGGRHPLPWDEGWQDRVTDIHRWLVRTLGDPLLALLDEEDTD